MSKKTLGAKPYLYPLTTVIVGANVNNKANFVTIAWNGMMVYNPPTLYIASGKNHHTNIGFRENNTFSVNLPSADMVKVTDYVGLVSGKKIDKSELFDVFYGELKTAPMIAEAPLNLECKIVKTLDLGGASDIIIGEIVQTYINEECLTDGKPDIKKLRPITFSGYDTSYFEVGDYIGKAYKIGKDYKKE